MLQIEALVKVYPGPVGALRGVDLEIPPGTVSYTHLTLPTICSV